MALHFEELDYRTTPIGDLMLRRRRSPAFGDLDIYEVKLGEHFLMTSLFHEAEVQLAKLGLAAVEGEGLRVVVGGLGLGYTAVAALEDERVASLIVVDLLEAVIGWHEQGLVPLGKTLGEDPRCRLLHADFFALAEDPEAGFDPERPGGVLDVILLDIDHTPEHLLDPGNAGFYTVEGLETMKRHLRPGGAFALWADGEPVEEIRARLGEVFDTAAMHRIVFPNPVTGREWVGAVYVAC